MSLPWRFFCVKNMETGFLSIFLWHALRFYFCSLDGAVYHFFHSLPSALRLWSGWFSASCQHHGQQHLLPSSDWLFWCYKAPLFHAHIFWATLYLCSKIPVGKYSMQPDINWVTRHTERAGKTWNVHKLKFLWIMNTWTRQPVKMFTGGIDNLSNINNAQVMGSGAINCDSNSNQWISQTKWAFVSDVTKNWGHPLCLTPEFRSLLSGPYRSRISSCALFPWLTPRLQLQVNYLAAFSIEKNCLNANSVFGVTCRLGIKKKSQFYCHDGSKFW